jgi:GxxExxY protein
MNVDHDNELTGLVIGAAIDVHRELGPANDEAAYEEALSLQLSRKGIAHECQKRMPVRYRGRLLDCGLRLDILVEERLPLELKSLEYTLRVHEAQLLTHIKMGAFPLGLLINFDVALLKEGIHRRALTLSPSTAGEPVHAEAKDGDYDALSIAILDAALAVHRAIGSGLLQSIYEECLCQELRLCGLSFARKQQVPLTFGGKTLRRQAEIPLLVEGKAPVFCLTVTEVTARHEATLRHRLRQGGFPFGYLLNFNAPTLKQGVRRMTRLPE